MRDPAALEGRTGGGGRRIQPPMRGKHNLAVCSHVHQQGRPRLIGRSVVSIPATVSPPTKPPITGKT